MPAHTVHALGGAIISRRRALLLKQTAADGRGRRAKKNKSVWRKKPRPRARATRKLRGRPAGPSGQGTRLPGAVHSTRGRKRSQAPTKRRRRKQEEEGTLPPDPRCTETPLLPHGDPPRHTDQPYNTRSLTRISQLSAVDNANPSHLLSYKKTKKPGPPCSSGGAMK